MEKIVLVTELGVTVVLAEWHSEDSKWDAGGWLEAFGDRIGTGTAPMPDECGFVDLRPFAIVKSA